MILGDAFHLKDPLDVGKLKTQLNIVMTLKIYLDICPITISLCTALGSGWPVLFAHAVEWKRLRGKRQPSPKFLQHRDLPKHLRRQ